MSAKDLKAHFGRKGHKKDSSTHDSSLALDPGSPRGGNTPNLSPRNPSTFVSLCNKDIPWIIEEETPVCILLMTLVLKFIYFFFFLASAIFLFYITGCFCKYENEFRTTKRSVSCY